MHCTMLAKLGRALVPLLKGGIETAWKAICPGGWPFAMDLACPLIRAD